MVVGIPHPLPLSPGTLTKFNPPSQKSLEFHKLGEQIPRCLYAGVNPWRLKEGVVQLAVKLACPLFGPGSDELCLHGTEGFSEKELSL